MKLLVKITYILMALLLLIGCGENKKGENMSYLDQQKILASDGEEGDYFGNSVSASGDIVVVGAINDDDLGVNAGAVYVYQLNTSTNIFEQIAKLTASDGVGNDQFGVSVSISGDTIVVGAYYDDDNGADSGSAYVFEKPTDGWVTATETAKLTASDGAAYDEFGYSVDISGDTIVVGAYNDYIAGSAYVFVKPSGSWITATEDAKLTPSDGAENDKFGYSVAISGDTIIVGASDKGFEVGAAYIFEKPPTGWVTATETAKLTASDAEVNNYFGDSVAINGDTIVVGAYGNGGLRGAAYIFEKPPTGWVTATETKKITASDGAFNDYFGDGVAINDNCIAIIGYLKLGTIYTYGLDGENEIIVRTEDYDAGDGLESVVALGENWMVLGTQYKQPSNTGAAYVFNVEVQDYTNYVYTDYIPSLATTYTAAYETITDATTGAYREYYSNIDTITYGDSDVASPNSLDVVNSIVDSHDEYAIGETYTAGDEVKVTSLGLLYTYIGAAPAVISDSSDFLFYHPNRLVIGNPDEKTNTEIWNPLGYIDEYKMFDGVPSDKFEAPIGTRAYNYVRFQKDNLYENDVLAFLNIKCEDIYVYFYADKTLSGDPIKSFSFRDISRKKRRFLLEMKDAAHLRETVVIDFVSSKQISIGGYMGDAEFVTRFGSTLSGVGSRRVPTLKQIRSDGQLKNSTTSSHDEINSEAIFPSGDFQEIKFALEEASENDTILHIGVNEERLDQEFMLCRINYDMSATKSDKEKMSIKAVALSHDVKDRLITPDSTSGYQA